VKIFYLATIKGRRLVSHLVESVSSNIYKVPYDSSINVYGFTIDGVECTQIDVIPVSGDPDFTCWFDTENEEIYFRINPSYITDGAALILEYVIGVTNDKDMYFNMIPSDSSSMIILFSSRMQRKPKFSQSQENNLVGILSISISSISLANVDQYFNQFINQYDSFKDSEVKIWECDVYPTDNRPFYTGFVSRLSVSDFANFTVNDIFRRMENILYSVGDSYEESIVKSNAGNQPTLSERPIYRLCGRNSAFKTEVVNYSGGVVQDRVLIPDSTPQATCIDYVPALSTSVNRTWLAGIIDDVVAPSDTFNIISVTVDSSTLPIRHIIEIDGDSNNFTYGDTFITNTAGIGAHVGRCRVGVLISSVISVRYFKLTI